MLTNDDLNEVRTEIIKRLNEEFEVIDEGEHYGSAIDWKLSDANEFKEQAKKEFVKNFIEKILNESHGKKKLIIHNSLQLFKDEMLHRQMREGFYGFLSATFE